MVFELIAFSTTSAETLSILELGKQWDGLLLTYNSASRCQTGSYDQPVNSEKESVMEIIRVGVDLAKNVYQVHGVDRKDKPVWRRQLSRQN